MKSEESLDCCKNRNGNSKKIACENTKVRQNQNRHQSSLDSEEGSTTDAEESLDGAKNQDGYIQPVL